MARRPGKASGEDARPLEAILWDAADKMRGNLEASEYKHVALGLVFLKYISDAFEQRHAYLQTATATPSTSTTSRIRRAGTSSRVARRVHLRGRLLGAGGGPLGVPPGEGEATRDRRPHRRRDGRDRTENPSLKGVLPKTYARADIDKRLLGELVDLIGSIGFTKVRPRL